MSQFTPTGGSAQLTGSVTATAAPKTSAVVTATVLVAATETPIALPVGRVQFLTKIRERGVRFRYAWTAGDIALGNYVTIEPGALYMDDNIDNSLNNKILYVYAEQASTLELHTWI